MRAEFILDSQQHPISIEHNGLKHYQVRLQLITENPNIRKVDYKLHPTYYDPYRESKDASTGFTIELKTYGDYYFIVEVTVGTELARQELCLSDLLKETYQSTDNASIQEALANIQSH